MTLNEYFAMEPADVVFRNARIVDGTGSPWRKGDVAVRDGRIAAVGPNTAGDAKETIDVNG